MKIYGWDLATWSRAFEWAKLGGYEFQEDYIDDPYRDHRNVRDLWLTKGGPLGGPLKLDVNSVK